MPARRNVRVLVLEPANQQLPFDAARPNGVLDPAYLVGALRSHGVEADDLDATGGWDIHDLQTTFYNHVEQDNGTVRYGMDPLSYTDRMQPRGRPLFHTEVPGERLQAAVREFWLELNSDNYTASKMEHSITSRAARLAS